MSAAPGIVTRFAPSPTGELHLGNARTALFNLLLARRAGGRFLLRIEDTDAERSQPAHAEALLEDLRWLGIDWDAGPGREDERGPYRQAGRQSIYDGQLARLEASGHVYPCFCSPLELDAQRQAQRSAGRPPRYAGTCRDLDPAERAARRAAGRPWTLRFRVPRAGRLEFVDFVHGAQGVALADIGDFVVRRADGSAAFFFANAVDDALMGVTHVLRGEDHLTNTPRQLLLFAALGLPHPRYGHVSLIVGPDGAPLSKRHGATSVRSYRERGYLPTALCNHLFRLGHSSEEERLLDTQQLAVAFDPARLQRAPAHFDEERLRVWQRAAVHALDREGARRWLAPCLPAAPPERLDAFVRAVLPNLVLPADVLPWVPVVFGELPELAPEALERLRATGGDFFAAASAAAETCAGDFRALAARVRELTGRRGVELFLPLRLALTGQDHGPELAALVPAMEPATVQARLARWKGLT